MVMARQLKWETTHHSFRWPALGQVTVVAEAQKRFPVPSHCSMCAYIGFPRITALLSSDHPRANFLMAAVSVQPTPPGGERRGRGGVEGRRGIGEHHQHCRTAELIVMLITYPTYLCFFLSKRVSGVVKRGWPGNAMRVSRCKSSLRRYVLKASRLLSITPLIATNSF
jgi:hypothetical protein